MVVSLQYAVVPLTVMLLAVHLGASLKCSGATDVFDWTSKTCIHISRSITGHVVSCSRPSVVVMIDRCNELNEHDAQESHIWYLPRLDSIEKQNDLFKIMRNIEPDGMKFWIAMWRQQTKSTDEAQDFQRWRDPTQWLWGVGKNDSLKDSFKWDEMPWAKNQPDNAYFQTYNETRNNDENCVVVKMKPKDADGPLFEWFDEHCIVGNPFMERVCKEPFRLLCEGERIKVPNRNGNGTEPYIGNPSAETTLADDSSPDRSVLWIALGSVFGILLIIAVIVVGVFMAKRRTQRKQEMKTRTKKSNRDDSISNSLSARSLSDSSTVRPISSKSSITNVQRRSERGSRTKKMPLRTGGTKKKARP